MLNELRLNLNSFGANELVSNRSRSSNIQIDQERWTRQDILFARFDEYASGHLERSHAALFRLCSNFQSRRM
jgi:hypothetical protein